MKLEDAISRQKVKEQMIKYGFHAPDMTVTEFVEQLPPVTTQPCTDVISTKLRQKNIIGGIRNGIFQ